MDAVLDTLQAVGIGAAIGIRPLLPVALVGLLAIGDLGVDFDGTDVDFLEAPVLVVVAILGALGSIVAEQRVGDSEEAGAGPLFVSLLVAAMALGALEGVGSLDDRGHSALVGAIAGVAGAALGFFAARALFGRVRRRLDREAQAALWVYAEGGALVAAGVSVLFPPFALVVAGALIWLLLGGRRRGDQKYAGLRILR